jgi:hypothetical protein
MKKISEFLIEDASDITKEEFVENVKEAFHKHFPNGYFDFDFKGMSDHEAIFLRIGMIGNPRDNVNGIPENDNMRHTVSMFQDKSGLWSFKSSGGIYVKPAKGSYKAMDLIKTGLGNVSSTTLKKAQIKLEKFFVKLSELMKENKDNINGVEEINPKYLIFR